MREAELDFRGLRSLFIAHLHVHHARDFYNFFVLPGFGPNDAAESDGILSPVSIYGRPAR